MMFRPPYFDVLVVGAGPAGLSLAIGCAQRGLKVALLARDNRNARKPHAETLPPRGEFLLRHLGIEGRCLAHAVVTSESLVAWDSANLSRSAFNFDPHGRSWVIDRRVFDEELRSAARDVGVQQWIVPSLSHSKVVRTGSSWSVTFGNLEHSLHIRSDFLVDASGLARVLARSRGAIPIQHDLLNIIWAELGPRHSCLPLLIEACPQGWWYSFSDPGSGLLCALVVDGRSRRIAGEATAQLWLSALKEAPHTYARVGNPSPKLSIAVAQSGRLDSAFGNGWLAVGDAAASFDPLASNGLCGGLEQGLNAAEAFAEGAGPTALRRYGDLQTESFDRYRAQRYRLYKGVARFSHDPFWHGRPS